MDDPEPKDEPPLTGARVPKTSLQVPGLVVLYRNQPVAAAPFGFEDPFSKADEVVTLVAAEVVAVGGNGVVKVKMEPKPVPTEFWAIAQ